MDVDGVTRRPVPWPDWSITTRIDCADHWQTVRRAIACHRSQLASLKSFDNLDDEVHRLAWGQQEFYRAYSLVNSGREVEDDLFAGLR
jgi:LmbE family N-acetylglucosaminyl deacetylase